nr:zinc finger CCCH domain-containing protein 18-like isoform X2 [Leptinotarsa decemlineata]
MDSEDSRDASSGSESGDEKGRRSRASQKSSERESNKSRSSTRSSSPPSRPQSASSGGSGGSRPQSPKDRSRASSNANSDRSRSRDSQSPENKSRSPRRSSQETPFTRSEGVSTETRLAKVSRSRSPDNKSPRDISPNDRRSGSRSQNGSRSTSMSPNPPSTRDMSPSTYSIKSKSPDSRPGSRSLESPAMAKSLVQKNSKSEDIHSPRSKSPDIPNTRVSANRSDSLSSSSDDDSAQNSRRNSTSPRTRHKSRERSNSRPLSSQAPQSPSSQSSRSSSPRSPHRGNVQQHKSDRDNISVKSDSSSSSRKSRSSRGSRKSTSSKGSRRTRKRNDISSDSSDSSVDSSSRKNKNIVKASDTQPEEISDGDIESDHDKDVVTTSRSNNGPKPEINISHEDLSDVSDLEDSMGGHSDEREVFNEEKTNGTQSKDEKIPSPEVKKVPEKPPRSEEGEEQLDFEAEDGECEAEPTKGKDENEEQLPQNEEKTNTDEKPEEKEKEEKEELEEGEVTDEDDVRPEETEPRPVCRFFSRGQCTWGASCRFLHPGVTDKGNYTMFDLIRPVVPGEFRDERLFGKVEPPVIESPWERGLRTAKEMLRKSMKRKEQDIDFEEKKMNLSLAQEEFDKENGYYGRVTSPEPRYVRHVTTEYPVARPPPEDYFGRRQVVYEPEYAPAAVAPPVAPVRERVRSYRELPSHRMPDFYNNKYEEEPQPHPSSSKRSKPKREVIVQRVEERPGRGDEWSDPWMRSKSPAGRRKDSGRKRSYSSGSSYSSSSSSASSRSSYRSRSPSRHRRRGSRSRRSRQVSPSVIVSERKAANERAALMNPPAPKRRAPSPDSFLSGMMRVSGAANPPAPSREDQFGRTRSKLAVAAALARVKGRRSSKSSSGSSGSSSSDSDSSDSSSSSSRDGSPPVRRPAAVELVKAMDALKGGALEKKQIKLNLKNPVGAKKPELAEFSRKVDSVQGKKRQASSPPPGDPKSKKATSRREELLKQLKAVEDAIAKKRSKV